MATTTAPVIVTAHKDTSAEDEAMEAVEESGADETSNVEVISVVSSPSLLVGQAASDSVKESGDAFHPFTITDILDAKIELRNPAESGTLGGVLVVGVWVSLSDAVHAANSAGFGSIS